MIAKSVAHKFADTIDAMEKLEQRTHELEELRDRLQARVQTQDLQISDLRLHAQEASNDLSAVRADRERAIADRAVFEVLFLSIRAQLAAFELPAEVLSSLPRKKKKQSAKLLTHQPEVKGNPAGLKPEDFAGWDDSVGGAATL